MVKNISPHHSSLANHFLVAFPSLDDPHFNKAVVYIHEHNEQGAMGLIINKPLPMQLAEVLQHLDITAESEAVLSQSVLMGGPVGQEHGFVLYEKNSALCLSSSKETLVAIAHNRGPERYVITLGYAGWQAGQLESELQYNHWLIVPFHMNILFDTPIEDRWQATAYIIGVDIERISNKTGHA